MYIDRDFALLTTATWSCRAPTLTDSVGVVFLCPGRTSGTSYHLTFEKCPINLQQLVRALKLFYFQTALISTSENNIKKGYSKGLNIKDFKFSTSVCAADGHFYLTRVPVLWYCWLGDRNGNPELVCKNASYLFPEDSAQKQASGKWNRITQVHLEIVVVHGTVYSLAGSASFVVDVIPNDWVILASSDWASHGKEKPGTERPLQQLADLLTFAVVRQVRMSTTTGVRHTWIGMSLLRRSQQHRRKAKFCRTHENLKTRYFSIAFNIRWFSFCLKNQFSLLYLTVFPSPTNFWEPC